MVIDDFESYTDDEGSRIYETWIDGFSTGLNGSTVGHIDPPFAEQIIVHDANQSMPLDYNNVKTPFYSETERELAPAQDWTAGGADALVLYVRGQIVNERMPLYVRIEDSAQEVRRRRAPGCRGRDRQELDRVADPVQRVHRLGREYVPRQEGDCRRGRPGRSQSRRQRLDLHR